MCPRYTNKSTTYEDTQLCRERLDLRFNSRLTSDGRELPLKERWRLRSSSKLIALPETRFEEKLLRYMRGSTCLHHRVRIQIVSGKTAFAS